jgi:sulfhydrogenase subunit gamma (sulfur reductase)
MTTIFIQQIQERPSNSSNSMEKVGFPPERIILSLEMRMKCGIGMCGRCNIGDKYVCKDGPVFSLAQLKNMPPEY